ncbi:MAG: hypothetical protein DGJ47_000238 [Rickettsiaceae bacterium]
MLQLQFDLKFEELSSVSGLQKLDKRFISYLTEHDILLTQKYLNYRKGLIELSELDQSDLYLRIAPYLDDFIAELFSIEQENNQVKASYQKFDAIYDFKRKFVQRYAVKKYKKENLADLSFSQVSQDLVKIIGAINQENIVHQYSKWQSDPIRYDHEIDLLAQYCSFMVHSNSSVALFDIPQAIDQNYQIRAHKIQKLQDSLYLGFDYRDHETTKHKSFAESKYCLYCHKRKKDTCRTGFAEDEAIKEKNGCPLKQKISEMSLLQSQGFNISALAVITIDNPMVAATGHRICNDCMKTCIYQKQEPVNIPIIESNILHQVLNFSWGVEIYLLLTKWNPLNIKQPLPLTDSGYNALVVGMGPAGFALSHYLLQLGHKVVGIDGLKINELPFRFDKPIKSWKAISTNLSEKTPGGFGGVAEYGITNRWDKNNLTLVRLILQRQKNFTLQGNVRLGSNLTISQAFEAGFHHIALCLGAGKPRYDNLPGFFSKGVRAAADFLMHLQQGGAFLKDNNAKLKIRMPAVVIGCGLTAIDSAVEVMHYYPLQVERFLSNWEKENKSLESLSEEEKIVAKEFISHANSFRNAKNDQEKIAILQQLGGVTICYRKSISESPAYRLNHEEVEQAMAAGVSFEEHFSPKEVLSDDYDHVKAIQSIDGKSLNARTILVAIGTENNAFTDIKNLDEQNNSFFKNKDHTISYFGDCNQKYAGSVVKALASAKDGYATINASIHQQQKTRLNLLIKNFQSTVKSIKIISPNLLELIIHSPFAANNFRPGQFFKLQNYGNFAKLIKPIALTGIGVNKERNSLTFAIFSSRNVEDIKNKISVGDEVSLMGPTGSPLSVVKGQKIVIIADNFNNIILNPIIEALRKNNCQIIYFANYSESDALHYRHKIEEFTDQIIWSSPNGNVKPRRKQDFSFKGNLVDSIITAKKKKIINDTDQVICYTSEDITKRLVSIKVKLFGAHTSFTHSLNSSMQCMMKGICGRCISLNKHNNTYSFTCIKQYFKLN